MFMYVSAFALSLGLCLLLTALIRRLATDANIVDKPTEPRKIHRQPTPLLGGLAVYLSFSLTLCVYLIFQRSTIVKDIEPLAIIGLGFGGLILMCGGYLDDRYRLKPGQQFLWSTAAALVAVASGLVIKGVTNPLGGTLHFDALPLVPALLGFAWLLGLMYTTKLLDGLDGLATGVSAIGSLIIFGLTQFTPFYQPSVGLLAVMLSGACFGFLFWNWHPAKIFLGEGGSLYLGFALGVFSIISGAKIATALLIMGVPILDVAWVILRRVFWDKASPVRADRKHLHHRLLEVGLSQRQAVVLLYLITASFGLSSLFLRTSGKVVALLALLVVMLGLAVWVVVRYKQKSLTSN